MRKKKFTTLELYGMHVYTRDTKADILDALLLFYLLEFFVLLFDTPRTLSNLFAY